MSTLLITLLSSLIPVGVESIKQFVTTKLGGVKATTIDEQIKLDKNEIERINALAALDNNIGGTPSQWVIDLRGSCRYVAALVVIGSGMTVMFVPEIDEAVKTLGFEAANIAFGFLFGSRVVSGFASGKK